MASGVLLVMAYVTFVIAIVASCCLVHVVSIVQYSACVTTIFIYPVASSLLLALCRYSDLSKCFGIGSNSSRTCAPV